MKKSELAVLLENKKEYTHHLCQLLTEPLFVEISSIYTTSREKVSEERILENFQDNLSKIPHWNADQVTALKDRIFIRMNCAYFNELLKATFLVYMKTYMATLENIQDTKDNIRIKVPTAEIFLHRTLVGIARALWKKPYLMYHRVRTMDKQRNILQCETYIHKAIAQTIHNSLPLQEIFQIMANETHIHTTQRRTSSPNESDAYESDTSDTESESQSESDNESEKDTESESEIESKKEKESNNANDEEDEEEKVVSESDNESGSDSATETDDEESDNILEEEEEEHDDDSIKGDSDDDISHIQNISINPIVVLPTKEPIGIEHIVHKSSDSLSQVSPYEEYISDALGSDTDESDVSSEAPEGEEGAPANMVQFDTDIKSLIIEDKHKTLRKKSIEEVHEITPILVGKEHKSTTSTPDIEKWSPEKTNELQETLFNKTHISKTHKIHKPHSVHIKSSKHRSKDAFF